MRLSKTFTTVTPLSKSIALAMFVLLPILGFLFGMYYQHLIDVSTSPQIIVKYTSSHPNPLPSPALIGTTSCRTNSDCPSGYYCTRVGPIVYNPNAKETSGLTCHKKGTFVPL